MNGRPSSSIVRLAFLSLAVAALGFPNTSRADAPPSQPTPIALFPENPRYFLFRGEPTFLLTSGEHYGAVLNGAFDFVPYLDELARRQFNQTRTFSGTYREVPGSFKIAENTLAPEPGRYVAPWARSETPGAADGGHKFDLDVWNDAYFQRLDDFVTQAGKRGIVVELVLFCPFYGEELWTVNPLNVRNNVNGVGTMPRKEVYTLKHPTMLARHEAFVRKVVTALKRHDNLYYEICNEPYFGGVTLDWQARIASAIVETERELGGPRHLIAQNVANGRARIVDPNPAVSVFNFHYAHPPDVIALNAGLNKVIGDDETGFRGNDDRPYRTEAWDFLIAGGGVFSNLDYSFTVAHPDGSAKVGPPTPGGGGPTFRKQLAILGAFLNGFDFEKMTPDDSVVVAGVPEKATARALAIPGEAYAIYVKGGSKAELTLNLPAGRYRAEWIDTKTGEVVNPGELDHPGGRVTLGSPGYSEDVALRVL
ncbi:MAG: cellulase family glycosylhydrolase, partial [Isosphaeraceae bacterium]